MVLNQYVILKKLGEGSCAEVKLCYDRDLKKKFAMKIVKLAKQRKNFMPKQQNTFEMNLLKEIAIMKKLNHPNLINLIEVIQEKEKQEIYIIMELSTGGSLSDAMERGKFSKEDIWSYFTDLILGLEYCHKIAKVVHHDIKPENLLLDS